MGDILDDLTLEDVENAYEESLTKSLGKNDNQRFTQLSPATEVLSDAVEKIKASTDGSENTKRNINDSVNQEVQQNSIQQTQLFCEFPKRSNTLKFALVRFGNNERYDIRNWYDNGEKPGKGLALTYEEIIKLRDSIKEFDLNASHFNVRGSYEGGKVSATIYDRICLFSEYFQKGEAWNKEVSIVDWGYGKKVDFRKWAADYSVCGKGIAVSFAEAEEIFDVIRTL